MFCMQTKAAPTVEPTSVPAAGGPVLSLGVHVHADTPPITLHLDQDQVYLYRIHTSNLYLFENNVVFLVLSYLLLFN